MKKQQDSIRQQDLSKWFKKKPSTSASAADQIPAKRIITKEEEKYQQQLVDSELDPDSEDFHRLQRVVKVKEVQKVKIQDYTHDVQAILINPKWRECDHFTKIVRLKGGGGSGSQTSSNSQADKTVTQDETPKEEEEENSDEEESKNSKRAFKGISMQEFQELIIPMSVMKDGILFIWVEKEYIMEVCQFLEQQSFFYVENMCWVMLNEKMKEGNLLCLSFFRGR